LYKNILVPIDLTGSRACQPAVQPPPLMNDRASRKGPHDYARSMLLAAADPCFMLPPIRCAPASKPAQQAKGAEMRSPIVRPRSRRRPPPAPPIASANGAPGPGKFLSGWNPGGCVTSSTPRSQPSSNDDVSSHRGRTSTPVRHTTSSLQRPATWCLCQCSVAWWCGTDHCYGLGGSWSWIALGDRPRVGAPRGFLHKRSPPPRNSAGQSRRPVRPFAGALGLPFQQANGSRGPRSIGWGPMARALLKH